MVHYCLFCEKEYEPKTSRHYFCTSECRILMYNELRKENSDLYETKIKKASAKSISSDDVKTLIDVIGMPMSIIENALQMPSGTLSKAVNGTRVLPKKFTSTIINLANKHCPQNDTIQKREEKIIYVEKAVITISENSILISF